MRAGWGVLGPQTALGAECGDRGRTLYVATSWAMQLEGHGPDHYCTLLFLRLGKESLEGRGPQMLV